MSNNSIDKERLAALEIRRTLKMARCAYADVGGNTAKFYEWLSGTSAAWKLSDGPSI